jgi:hypothetical protein
MSLSARAYLTKAPSVGSSLARNHKTKLEKLARDKHLSLSRRSVNCSCKKFCNTDPCIMV